MRLDNHLATAKVVAMRWLAAVGGASVLAIVACGSSGRSRDAFPSAPDAGEDPTVGYGDAGAASDPCDPSSLFEARSNAGCHFVATASTLLPQHPDWVPEGCYALAVSNPSGTSARLRLRFKGRADDVPREEDATSYARRAVVDGRNVRYEPLDDGTLAPGESAVVSALFVPYRESEPGKYSRCPVEPAFVQGGEPGARDMKVTPAIELLSNVPVQVAFITQYGLDGTGGEAPSATYALTPVHLWERNAVDTGLFHAGMPAAITVAAEDGDRAPFPLLPARTFTLAALDDTHVTLPTMDGGTQQVTLQRGEVFSLTTAEATIGRAATADKPIALVTLAPNAIFPWSFWDEPRRLAPDHDRYLNMFLPTRVWGSEYVAARHADRWAGMPEEPAWRLIGGADGTALTYEPYRPKGAPERVAKGELAVFYADAPFVVRSQDGAHPFYLGGTMLSSSYQRERHGHVEPYPEFRGHSVSVHTLPTSSFKKRYAFFAPPGAPESSLVLVRVRGAGDVRLDCAGPLTGWQPITDGFEILRVRLSGPLHAPVELPGGTCQAGAHWIEGDGPFGATLWGWGSSEVATVLGNSAYDQAHAFPLAGVDPPSTAPTN